MVAGLVGEGLLRVGEVVDGFRGGFHGFLFVGL